MKKWIPWIIILFVLVAGMYSFAYFFVLPKSAQALVPLQWQTRILKQKRTGLYYYLGKPIDTAMKNKSDNWVIRNGNFIYSLSVNYSSIDTTVQKYSISYEFKNSLFYRSGIIVADSTEENYFMHQ